MPKNKLLQVLNEMKKQDKWRKIPSAKGVLEEKLKTKSGNIKLVLEDHIIYVQKRNKNLYEKADNAKVGDLISARGKLWLGRFLVFKLDVKKERQMKLV